MHAILSTKWAVNVNVDDTDDIDDIDDCDDWDDSDDCDDRPFHCHCSTVIQYLSLNSVVR